MKANGQMIGFMEMEHSTIIKAIYTKDNFIMEKLMVMVYVIRVMEVYLKVNIYMGKSMGLACIRHLTEN